jgi:hypothetical protein
LLGLRASRTLDAAHEALWFLMTMFVRKYCPLRTTAGSGGSTDAESLATGGPNATRIVLAGSGRLVVQSEWDELSAANSKAVSRIPGWASVVEKRKQPTIPHTDHSTPTIP